jgi:hypothetical protein
MGMFSAQIKDAKIFGKGSNIRDGKYVLMIESVTEKQNQKKEGQFIAEFRVIKAEAIGEYEIAADGKSTTTKPVVPNAPGTSCSFVQVSKHDSATSNIKGFLLGALSALGYTEEQIDGPLYDEATGENQPLRGLLVGCETIRTLNQGKTNPANRGNILVLPKWSPIEQNEADIIAGKKFLDENKAKAPAVEAAKPAPESTAPVVEVTPAPTPAPVSAPVPGGRLASLLGGKK